MAASAPRYKAEGRIKGKYGPHKRRKRVKRGPSVSESERFARITPDQINRVKHVQGLLAFLLTKREETPAAGVVLEVVQLLSPLTGLPDGAVTRDDLPTESTLPAGRMAMLAAQWGGRVDIDLVSLFTSHRATFEQLARVLSDWQTR